MKELRRNARIIGILVLCMFIGMSVFYGITVYDQGAQWASNVYNRRLNRANAYRGPITDRDGVVLAKTGEDGSRLYLSDEAARRALSQTVGDTMGMSGTGVECYYSSILMDISGSLLDRIGEVFNDAPHQGSSVQLTIDAQLSAYISSIFPEGKNGAVCIINYRTGEILVMVSKPDYDPWALVNGADENVADSAYLNRCLQGLYTPGSVFKIVTLASALNNYSNISEQTFSCSSRWEYEGGSIVCGSGNISHGTLSLKSAFARSCNVTFGKIAYSLGIESMLATAQTMGFNENFHFDDITLYNSSFPTRADNTSELVWAGIGQGEVLVTPLHMCMITGAVANDGVMMEPKLILNIQSNLGITTRTLEPSVYRRVLTSQQASLISDYMYEAVRTGTAKRAQIDGFNVCGKTGSAETSDDKTKKTNAWYVGYIDSDEFPYAIAVVIEEGGAGGDQAATLAAKALGAAIAAR